MNVCFIFRDTKEASLIVQKEARIWKNKLTQIQSLNHRISSKEVCRKWFLYITLEMECCFQLRFCVIKFFVITTHFSVI